MVLFYFILLFASQLPARIEPYANVGLTRLALQKPCLILVFFYGSLKPRPMTSRTKSDKRKPAKRPFSLFYFFIYLFFRQGSMFIQTEVTDVALVFIFQKWQMHCGRNCDNVNGSFLVRVFEVCVCVKWTKNDVHRK